MVRRYLWAAATLMAFPMAANAQPVTGPYVGLGVGGNYAQQWNLDTLSGAKNAFFPNRSGGSGWGFVGLGSLGYGFGNGFRVEVEGNYRGEMEHRQIYGGMVN